ncbi:MAG: extracellular solute-binding protein [Alphaproteobacteria bacterium]
MSMIITRRQALHLALAGTALAAVGRPALAQSRTLNILAHRVHQLSLTEGAAGDLTAPWRDANDADISWTTFDTGPLQDRLMREASLGETDFGVGFLVNNRADAAAASLMHPLDDFQASDGIEDFADIAPGLVEAMTIDGKLIGIPFRHATQGLFYNEALLEEAGISAPPTTLEELVEQAGQATFTSAEGTPVVGLVLASDLAVYPVMFARAFGGDFITGDLQLMPDPEPMVKGIRVLQGMFEAGSLPRSYATTKNEDQVTWLQQGRAAFAILPFSRHAQLNRDSAFAGRIKAVEMPISEALLGQQEMATVVEFWAMSIPGSAADKELAWSFIRHASSKAVTLGAARNGNGPVRVSTYAEPEFTADQPLAAVEAAALSRARVPFPAFPESARAQADFLEEVALAVLGQKTAEEAVAAIQERVTPLLPG